MNIGQIAKMAQQMQTQMAQAQDELKETTLEATAGGGAVIGTVFLDGRNLLEEWQMAKLWT